MTGVRIPFLLMIKNYSNLYNESKISAQFYIKCFKHNCSFTVSWISLKKFNSEISIPGKGGYHLFSATQFVLKFRWWIMSKTDEREKTFFCCCILMPKHSRLFCGRDLVRGSNVWSRKLFEKFTAYGVGVREPLLADLRRLLCINDQPLNVL